jgi:hypothetical protein
MKIIDWSTKIYVVLFIMVLKDNLYEKELDGGIGRRLCVKMQ